MHAEKRNFQEKDTDKENEKQNMDDNSKKMGPLEGNQNFSEKGDCNYYSALFHDCLCLAAYK